MVWSCEKGNGGRSVEISGRNGRIEEKESRKTRENLERYSEEGLELIRVDESMALEKMEKDYPKSDLYLKRKYGL